MMNSHTTIRYFIATTGLALVAFPSAALADDFYFSFDGPFLKSYPAQAGAEITQDGQASGLAVRFTCPWQAGKVGDFSFYFQGRGNGPAGRYGDWAQSDNHPVLNPGRRDFGVSLWLKSSSARWLMSVLDKRDEGGAGYHVALYRGRPLLQLEHPSLGWTNYLPSKPDLRDGDWHKLDIYVTRGSSSGGKMYVDGILVHTFDATRYAGADISNGEPLWIGWHVYSHSYNFVGHIDELRIWKG